MARSDALRISTGIWRDPGWRSLPAMGQLAFWYLACLERESTVPTIPVDVDRWVSDLNLSIDSLWAALNDLIDGGWITYGDEIRITDMALEHFILPSAATAIERERARVTLAVRQAVFERHGRACRACGATERLAIDHIVALAAGGTSDLDNLQVLCRSCNSSKNVLSWDDFMARREGR